MKITTDLMYARDERGGDPAMVWFARCTRCRRMTDPAWTEEKLTELMGGWLITETEDFCPECLAAGIEV